jgi:hypothetical protein
MRTGDWALSTSLNYYLDLHGDDRFQTVYMSGIQRLLEQMPEDHFWIAFFDLAEWPQPPPELMLNDNGYRAGDAITYQHMNNRVVLLPVWRK